jgi:hypothetical protein
MVVLVKVNVFKENVIAELVIKVKTAVTFTLSMEKNSLMEQLFAGQDGLVSLAIK